MGWDLTLAGYDAAASAQVLARAGQPDEVAALRARLEELVPREERDPLTVEALREEPDPRLWREVLFAELALRTPQVFFGRSVSPDDWGDAARRLGQPEVGALLSGLECDPLLSPNPDEVEGMLFLLAPARVQALARACPADVAPLSLAEAGERLQALEVPGGVAALCQAALPLLLGACRTLARDGLGLALAPDGLPRLRGSRRAPAPEGLELGPADSSGPEPTPQPGGGGCLGAGVALGLALAWALRAGAG